jgi:hypothetical protein
MCPAVAESELIDRNPRVLRGASTGLNIAITPVRVAADDLRSDASCEPTWDVLDPPSQVSDLERGDGAQLGRPEGSRRTIRLSRRFVAGLGIDGRERRQSRRVSLLANTPAVSSVP